MKLTTVTSPLLLVAVACTTVSAQSCSPQVDIRGTIVAPPVDLGLAPRHTFNFAYTPSNWCYNAYSGVSAYLTRTSEVYVDSTGNIGFTYGDSFGVLWDYGDWVQSNLPNVNPPTSNAPPTVLTMPDFTHLGIVPGQIYFSVIETANNCDNTLGGPTQYTIRTIRLINT